MQKSQGFNLPLYYSIFWGQISDRNAWFRGYRVHGFELGVQGVWF